jgi:hypothetical protein
MNAPYSKTSKGYKIGHEDVGLNSTGFTYGPDGISNIVLNTNPEDHNTPQADITNIRNGTYEINTRGNAGIYEWEKLLLDLLGHIQTLKK